MGGAKGNTTPAGQRQDVQNGPIRTRSQPRSTRDDRRAKKQQQRNETR